jgi:protein-S-isoprenylcysteine O-methyltransferase Ste14
MTNPTTLPKASVRVIVVGSVCALDRDVLVWPRRVRTFLQATDGPAVSIPPTLIFVLGYLGGLVLNARLPLPVIRDIPIFETTVSIVGIGATAVGLALVVWTWRTLARERTGVMLQQAATRLVERGPYGWSRNPMYIAFVVTYIGLALIAISAWPFVTLPVVLFCLERYVIDREERYLEQTFGDLYRAYCARVGRWVIDRG